ncbi:helix-turn-helix transcriptional regulator [Halocola ammonii]
MSLDTPKRFDRIIAILIQLQSKKIIRASELAERFQVSERTIYRDIRTIEQCGVPIVSEAGVGYSIMEGYRLPPVMFTREEASSFVAAQKLMEKFTDESMGKYFDSAMFKLKSVLRGSEKDWVAALENQVFISPSQELFNRNVPNALEVILESIAEQKQIKFQYQSFGAEAPSLRNIEPVGIFHENGFWYLMAWCHLRQEYRQFRTDRIQSICRVEDAFTKEHGNINDHLEKPGDYERNDSTVRIIVDREMARYMSSGKKFYGLVEEKFLGDRVEMTFQTDIDCHGFTRWFMMFADYAEIIEPISLRENVRKLAEQILESVSQPAPHNENHAQKVSQ